MDHEAYRTIDVARDGAVVTITIRRPEKHNALNNAAMLDLQRAFGEIRLDRSIDAVVLTGAGDRAFSAGADITQYAGPTADHDPDQRERQDLFYEVYRAPLDCHAPVIAKVNGYCVGGGLILALYCDLRVASDDAQFAVPVTEIGQIPTGGVTRRAMDLVGEAHAKELVYTAGYVDAADAERIGLINRAVPEGDLDAAVDDLLAGIRGGGREAVKRSKRAFERAADAPDLEAARAVEADLWWEQFATDERRRLVDAFNEDDGDGGRDGE